MEKDKKIIAIGSPKFNKWLKERDVVAYSFSVPKFKAFFYKWAKAGIYEREKLPSDEVIEILLRKMVCAMKDPDPDKLKEARGWLTERGYKWTI